MRSLTCIVKSHVHELPENIFSKLDQISTYIVISRIDNTQLKIEITDVMEPDLSDDELTTKAHKIFNLYIVALNVCSVGLFMPTEDNFLSPKYTYLNSDSGVTKGGIISHEIHKAEIFGRTLTEQELIESLLFYGALAKEENDELISEYLRGVIHLSLNYPGAHFEKDAFANYFRVFEHLVTTRVLGLTKLKNEFKEYTKALHSFGISQALIDEFKELYKLRSRQAMHAYLSPAAIDRETTMKMKLFCDITVQNVYRPIWEAEIKRA